MKWILLNKVLLGVLVLAGTLGAVLGVRATTAATPSKLIFGTNLGLYNSSDPFLTSPSFRAGMSNIHVQFVRMPIRESGTPPPPSAIEIQAMQDIKALGLVPLIILNGPVHSTALADDMNIIKVATTIFGSQSVYFELGNEEDLQGITPQAYTNGWNAIVPSLKSMAPQDKFIGPVVSRYDRTWLSDFVTWANPAPDFVSWHEYVCGPADTNATCIANISHFSAHMSDFRSYSQQPVMITEFNWDAFADSRNGNDAFANQWTTAAMEALVSLGVAGADQYAVSSSATEHLLSDTGVPTGQGVAFQAEYAKYFGSTPTPTGTPNPTPTPTGMPGYNCVYQATSTGFTITCTKK